MRVLFLKASDGFASDQIINVARIEMALLEQSSCVVSLQMTSGTCLKIAFQNRPTAAALMSRIASLLDEDADRAARASSPNEPASGAQAADTAEACRCDAMLTHDCDACWRRRQHARY